MFGKQNLIFLGGTLLIITGLVWYIYFFKPEGNIDNIDIVDDSNIVLPNVSNVFESPIVSPMPAIIIPKETPRPSPKLETPEPFVGLNGIKSPATCQVYGEVEFISSDLFISKESKISWQNIDSRGRWIKWHVSPADDLSVGPNIFESLPIPEGQYQNLTVRLPEKPISKSYLLTASVTYGQFVKGNLEVKEANCTGTVRVNLNF